MTPYPFMRLSRADFRSIKAKAAAKRSKRMEKRVQNADLKAQTASRGFAGVAGTSNSCSDTPKRATVKIERNRTKRKPSARKTAFKRLKDLCGMFVRLRAKHRTGGTCEVGTLCGGVGPIQVPYHVIPAATGNAIKYDARNLLGACSRCNGSEYFDRKRGTYGRHDKRHAEILGAKLLAELKAAAGRKPISTVEASEMAEEFRRKMEQGEWR